MNLPSIVERAVRETLARTTRLDLDSRPVDDLDPLGDPVMWISEALCRLTLQYGPRTSEVLHLTEKVFAQDRRVHLLLKVSGLDWQPDIVLALAAVAMDQNKTATKGAA
jgi:hypothetical protein